MPLPAPLLFVNGIIHASLGEPPVAALAIDRASGRVVAAGTERDVRAELGIFAALETIDLRGRAIVPGLIDAHTHLVASARDAIEIDLAGTRDAEEAAARVAARAAQTPAAAWIVGGHWNQNEWTDRRFPTRDLLDAAAPDHPVLLWTHSRHAIWVNSLALRRAGIDETMADPPGGTIARDQEGIPTGMLFESATALVVSALAAESTDGERLRASVARVLSDLRARGLTATSTMMSPDLMESERELRLLQSLRESGELPVRVRCYLPLGRLETARALGLEARFGDAWLRIAGIKLYLDGALGTRTAAMLEPYEDVPGSRGILTMPGDVLARRIADALGGGLGVAIHAIGDRAVHVALDSIDDALARVPEARRDRSRVRLEHVQLIAPDDIARMAQLGVTASVQPFHAVSDRDVAERAWGAGRAARSYAYATLADRGVRLALGSDLPIETADPWRIVHAAVARTDDRSGRAPWRDGAEALGIARALWGYTIGAAWASGDESEIGTLAPGSLADFVVLATDPLRLAPHELALGPVVATVLGGQLVSGTL
jgi:predicted amidohydrolase YtcJ